jgi:hypothetical protein
MLIGGYHIDRFLFWGMIAFLPLAASLIHTTFASDNSWLWKVLFWFPMFVAQLASLRFFNTIPDANKNIFLHRNDMPEYYFLSPYGNGTHAFHMTFMNNELHSVHIQQYSILILYFITIGCILKYISNKD